MTNSTSLFDQQMRESRDPFSATNMMNKNMMNSCAKKLFKRDSDLSSSSSYSSSSRDYSPDTPAVLAMKEKLKSMPNHAHLFSKPSVNATSTSNSFNFTKLLVSCFTR